MDYTTAQNIISGKCGNGNVKEDDEFWDQPRRPVDGVSRETIAEKVRLMHIIGTNWERVNYCRNRLRQYLCHYNRYVILTRRFAHRSSQPWGAAP